MKTKVVSEYFVLTGLCVVTGYVLYRYEQPLQVYASSADNTTIQIVSKAPTGITAAERQTIRNYVATFLEGKHRSLPAGLIRKATRGNLPSDWESKLVKGQLLPAEILRQGHPLPAELDKHLPAPALGTFRTAINGRILLLAAADMKILDVFDPQ